MAVVSIREEEEVEGVGSELNDVQVHIYAFLYYEPRSKMHVAPASSDAIDESSGPVFQNIVEKIHHMVRNE